MGLFSGLKKKISKLGHTVSHAVGSVVNKIKGGASKVSHGVAHAVGSVTHAASSTVSTVYNDAKHLVNNVVDKTAAVVQHGQDAVQAIASTAGNTITGTARNLSLPLTIGIGIAGMYLISQSRR